MEMTIASPWHDLNLISDPSTSRNVPKALAKTLLWKPSTFPKVAHDMPRANGIDQFD